MNLTIFQKLMLGMMVLLFVLPLALIAHCFELEDQIQKYHKRLDIVEKKCTR